MRLTTRAGTGWRDMERLAPDWEGRPDGRAEPASTCCSESSDKAVLDGGGCGAIGCGVDPDSPMEDNRCGDGKDPNWVPMEQEGGQTTNMKVCQQRSLNTSGTTVLRPSQKETDVVQQAVRCHSRSRFFILFFWFDLIWFFILLSLA